MANKKPQIFLTIVSVSVHSKPMNDYVMHNLSLNYLKQDQENNYPGGYHIRLILQLSSFTQFAFFSSSFPWCQIYKLKKYWHFLSRWLMTTKTYFFLPCAFWTQAYIVHANGMTCWNNGQGHALPITVIQEFYLFPLSTYHIKLEALCDAEISLFSSPVFIITLYLLKIILRQKLCNNRQQSHCNQCIWGTYRISN